MSTVRIQRRGDNVTVRRDALANTLEYVNKSPTPNLHAVISRYTVTNGGPAGDCEFYSLPGGSNTDNAIERIKIPYQVPGGPIFNGFDSNRKVSIQHVVLKALNPGLFQRLYDWSKKLIDRDSDETWVIAHRCHRGAQHCYNINHLFLATNSVNQLQRNCPVAQGNACLNCGATPACTCPNLQNAAMPNNDVPSCIAPLALPAITALQNQLNASQAQVAALTQQVQALTLRLDNANQRMNALAIRNSELIYEEAKRSM